MSTTYTVASAFEQIDKCDFECEGGPLANNLGYRWLKEHVAGGPKYCLGQWVYFQVQAEVSGVKLSTWAKLCIVAISMSSDTERRTWNYSLSVDPPQPYHYGSGVQFAGVAEKALSETSPAHTAEAA